MATYRAGRLLDVHGVVYQPGDTLPETIGDAVDLVQAVAVGALVLVVDEPAPEQQAVDDQPVDH